MKTTEIHEEEEEADADEYYKSSDLNTFDGGRNANAA